MSESTKQGEEQIFVGDRFSLPDGLLVRLSLDATTDENFDYAERLQKRVEELRERWNDRSGVRDLTGEYYGAEYDECARELTALLGPVPEGEGK